MSGDIISIGFIGVGGIGRPMAEHLIRAGFQLIVCDMRSAALEPFLALGARATSRPADCADADMVIVMVADDAQATNAINDLLEGIDSDRPPLVAMMSTVLPDTVKSLSAVLAQKNARLVDAPVSGGAVKAARGELSIIAGGETAVLTAMMPVFEALGASVVQCGPLGAGEAVKILNNLVAVTVEFLMAEMVSISGRIGIDSDLLFAVMEHSSGRNFITADIEAHKVRFRSITADPVTLKAHAMICQKDLRLARALAEQLEVAAPALDAIAQALGVIPYALTLKAWEGLSEDAHA